MHTFYTGTSFDGTSYSQEVSPIRKPGIYTETIYFSDENYYAVPVSRIFTIQRETVDIRFDQASVTARYDGNPHGLSAGVYVGNERIAETEIFYSYIGVKAGEIVYTETEPPTECGVYLVVAAYPGGALHQAAFSREGSLIILGADAVISIEPVQHIVLDKTASVQYSGNKKTPATDTGDSNDPTEYIAALIIAAFVIAAILFWKRRTRK